MLLAGCSTVCTTVAEAAKMWNLIVVSSLMLLLYTHYTRNKHTLPKSVTMRFHTFIRSDRKEGMDAIHLDSILHYPFEDEDDG